MERKQESKEGGGVCSAAQPEPVDCGPSASSVHGISQAGRILEWVAASPVSPARAGGFFTLVPPGKQRGAEEERKDKEKGGKRGERQT